VLAQAFLQGAQRHAGIDEIGLDGQRGAQRLLGFLLLVGLDLQHAEVVPGGKQQRRLGAAQPQMVELGGAFGLAGVAHQAGQADQLHDGQGAALASANASWPLASTRWRQGPGSVPAVANHRWGGWHSCWYCRLNPSRIQSSHTKVRQYS
jgi:hypothetical protein